MSRIELRRRDVTTSSVNSPTVTGRHTLQAEQDPERPCMTCRGPAPTVFVSLSQTQGLLVRRHDTHLDRRLCGACLDHYFRRFTKTNLVFGWWSPFSAFLTPIYTIQNILMLTRARAALKRFAPNHPTPLHTPLQA